MTRESLANQDWQTTLGRLGGAARVEELGKETKGFLRRRGFGSADDCLRLLLGCCWGHNSYRLTAAWGAASGLCDISDPAVHYRLAGATDWFAALVSDQLAKALPAEAQGRLLRIVDGTTVPKWGGSGRKNRLWRIHCCFNLPNERFSAFEMTDGAEGERIDRIEVAPGEIRIGDRAYLHPDRMAEVMEKGGDVLVRSGWKATRWLDEDGTAFDLIEALQRAKSSGTLERSIMLELSDGKRLPMRLVAARKPDESIEKARRKAKREAQRCGNTVSKKTLEAADWVILVTSLKPEAFSLDALLQIYRLRWRIELAIKRLKSIVGLKGPPGIKEATAKSWILAQLLLILLTEPLADELGDSPRWAVAA